MRQLIEFMTEYTQFFEKLEQKQVEKLGLLMTKELGKIEEAIMMQQALDKQLENWEQRRLELFAALGISDKSLKEAAEAAGGREQTELLSLYKRLDGAVGNICFYNKKAENLARSELEQMGIDSRMVGNPAGLYGKNTVQTGQRMEKKV